MNSLFIGASLGLVFFVLVYIAVVLRRKSRQRALTGPRAPATTPSGATPLSPPTQTMPPTQPVVVTSWWRVASTGIGGGVLLGLIGYLLFLVGMGEYRGVPGYLYLAAVVALIFIIVVIWWSGIKPSPDTAWKLFVTFCAFMFLEWVLYHTFPNSPLFNGPGLWHLVIYPIGMLIFSAANDLGDRKKTPVALMVAAFAILGLGGLARLDGEKWNASEMFAGVFTPRGIASFSPLIPAKVSAPRFVLGAPQTNTYGPGLTLINKDNWQVRGYLWGGCASWYDASGNRLARSCEGFMPSVNGIVSVRPDTEVVMKFLYCPLWTPGNSLDHCG